MKSIRKSFKFFLIFLSIIGALFIYSISILYLDDKSYCLDIGKIYDPIQKICRDDCLTWDDKTGCVPITEENIKKKSEGML